MLYSALLTLVAILGNLLFASGPTIESLRHVLGQWENHGCVEDVEAYARRLPPDLHYQTPRNGL